MADLIVKVCNTTSNLEFEKPTPIPTNISRHFPFHRIRSGESPQERDSIALEIFDSAPSFKTAKSKDVETFESITELSGGQLAVKMKREVHMFVEKRDSDASEQKSFKTTRRGVREGLVDGGEESDEGGLEAKMKDMIKEDNRVRRPGLEDGMGVTTTVSAL